MVKVGRTFLEDLWLFPLGRKSENALLSGVPHKVKNIRAWVFS